MAGNLKHFLMGNESCIIISKRELKVRAKGVFDFDENQKPPQLKKKEGKGRDILLSGTKRSPAKAALGKGGLGAAAGSMNTDRGIFFVSALRGGEGSARSGTLTPPENERKGTFKS